MKKKQIMLISCAAFVLGSGIWGLNPWVTIKNFTPQPISLPPITEIESFIEEQEKPFLSELRSPLLKKTIHWAKKNQQTEVSVLYLHGFSASPMEMDPVPQEIAKKIGANLYSTRLSGHGLRDGNNLGRVSPEVWLQDGYEGFQVAKLLGKKVIIIANSMGTADALWLASLYPESIDSMVLFSPYLKLANLVANFLDKRGGLQAVKLFKGETRTLPKGNNLEQLYWTTQYPISAVGSSVALVHYVRRQVNFANIQIPTVVFYTQKDQTVNPTAIEKMFEKLGSPNKELIQVEEANQHVLGGNAIQPETNTRLIEESVAFCLESHVSEQ